MASKPAPVAPEWLVPGVNVLVVRGHSHSQSITRTTVEKVYKRYFTVDYRAFADLRFNLDRQEHHSPGMFSSSTRVVRVASDEGRKLLEVARRARLLAFARDACDQWQRTLTRESRLAAISALKAVEDGCNTDPTGSDTSGVGSG
jgi:hypothetical protein